MRRQRISDFRKQVSKAHHCREVGENNLSASRIAQVIMHKIVKPSDSYCTGTLIKRSV